MKNGDDSAPFLFEILLLIVFYYFIDGAYSAYDRNVVEDENETLVDGLQTKITALKSVRLTFYW